MDGLKKILIIRFSSFGDIVLSFPLIKALKEKYPSAEVHFLTKSSYKEVLELNPNIDSIIAYSGGPVSEVKKRIKNKNYDLILDLHKNFRSRAITRFASTKTLKIKKDNTKKFLLVRFKINLFKEVIPVYKKYLRTAGKYLDTKEFDFTLTDLDFAKERRINEDYIVIAPSSRHFTKTYPKEKFLEYIKRNSAKKFILVGDSSGIDTSICNYLEGNSDNTINLCGELGYKELANILYFSKFVICNDSGILHLSEALGRKVRALFGCTVKEFGFFPQLSQSTVLDVKNLECRPCTHIGLSKCPKKHFRCMNEINLNKESR